jgi:hypothetical protein
LKRQGIFGLVLATTLALGAGTALAAKSYPTKIKFLGTEGQSASDLTVVGGLKSNPKCVGARKVGLYKKASSGDFKLLDVDLSSYNGAWATRADLTGAPDLAVKVTKDTRNHGKVICKSDTITLSASSAKYQKVG